MIKGRETVMMAGTTTRPVSLAENQAGRENGAERGALAPDRNLCASAESGHTTMPPVPSPAAARTASVRRSTARAAAGARPSLPGDVKVSDSEKAADKPADSRAKVLVVDDQPENIRILMQALQGQYRLSVARSGQDALRVIASSSLPDLILLDIEMPDMDGYEVCRRLKAQQEYRGIPIIFITSRTEVEDETRGFEIGGVDYIPKPISPPVVRVRVKNQLDLIEANRALRETQASLVQAEKLAALGSLVAGMAHEINTPVGIAYTSATHLETRARDFADQIATGQLKRSLLENFVSTVLESSVLLKDNSRRAASLVQSFKAIDINRISGDIRHIRLGEYLEQLLAQHRQSALLASRKVMVDCPAEVEVTCDVGALGLVVGNLMDNVEDHAYPCDPEGSMEIRGRLLSGGEVEISVIDQGRGVEAAELGKLFDPFFTTARGAGHIGLGLHVAFNAVNQALNGRIYVDSRKGEGTRVTLLFPPLDSGKAG